MSNQDYKKGGLILMDNNNTVIEQENNNGAQSVNSANNQQQNDGHKVIDYDKMQNMINMNNITHKYVPKNNQINLSAQEFE